MRDIVFLAAFISMLPMAVRFSHIGTMLWTWVALVSPNAYLYGFARGLPFNKIVVAVAFLSLFIDKARRKMYFDTHVRLLIAFLAIGMLSYMFALSDKSRVDVLADRLFKEVLLCLFIVISARGRNQIHSVLIALCMGLAIHGSIEGSKYIKAAGGHVLQGPSTIGDNNAFGLAILVVIPLLIYLYRYSASVLVRLALVLAIGTNLVAVVATSSRGALIGLIAVGLAMFARSKHKLGLGIVFVLMLGIAAGFAPERWYGRMSTIATAEDDGSFIGRVNSWKLHFLVAVDHPLLGGGFSPMEDAEVWKSYLPKLAGLDFIPTGRPGGPLAAHSIYFEVLGDLGFTGFFVFIGLIFVAFRNMRIILRLTRDKPEFEWARDLAEMFRLSLIAYTVAGAALSMAYFELFYILITLISVTRHYVQEQVDVPVPAGLAILQARRSVGPGAIAVPGMARTAGSGSMRPR